MSLTRFVLLYLCYTQSILTPTVPNSLFSLSIFTILKSTTSTTPYPLFSCIYKCYTQSATATVPYPLFSCIYLCYTHSIVPYPLFSCLCYTESTTSCSLPFVLLSVLYPVYHILSSLSPSVAHLGLVLRQVTQALYMIDGGSQTQVTDCVSRYYGNQTDVAS